MTTPYPDGPGLPRAPPSLKATRCCAGGDSRSVNSSRVCGVREEYDGMAKFTLGDGRGRPSSIIVLLLLQVAVEPSRHAFGHVATVFGLKELMPLSGINYELRLDA